MAQWLIIVSWVAVILGLLTAIVIAFDVMALLLAMEEARQRPAVARLEAAGAGRRRSGRSDRPA